MFSLKEELLHCIECWREDIGSSKELAILESVTNKIQNDNSLNETEAKFVEHRLNRKIENLINEHKNKGANFIEAAGDVAIYYDIWYNLCRPNTYSK